MRLLPKLLTLSILFLTGCGPAFLPQPTSRPVDANDIIGSWTLDGFRPMTQNAKSSHYTVTVDIRPDYTFTQRIQWEDRPDHQEATGTWSMDGAYLLLDGVLMEEFDFE